MPLESGSRRTRLLNFLRGANFQRQQSRSRSTPHQGSDELLNTESLLAGSYPPHNRGSEEDESECTTAEEQGYPGVERSDEAIANHPVPQEAPEEQRQDSPGERSSTDSFVKQEEEECNLDRQPRKVLQVAPSAGSPPSLTSREESGDSVKSDRLPRIKPIVSDVEGEKEGCRVKPDRQPRKMRIRVEENSQHFESNLNEAVLVSHIDLKPLTTPPHLSLAFDIGTTFSGISYSIQGSGQIPQILRVARFPAQKLVGGDVKVPSLLYYDKRGLVQAAGAEVLAENIVEQALSEGWSKAEWWKLHLRPANLYSCINPDDIPPLPHGKTAVDVLTDFTLYLFRCAKTYILERHPFTWSAIEHSVEYVFTYPNGWEGAQQLYFQAIVRAGLIPSTPEGRSRVHMLTEGEASLHSCIPKLLAVGEGIQSTSRGVVVIDAGGGTIDLSMFSITCDQISGEEIAPAMCQLQGSIFISRRAKNLLRKRLAGWEHASDDGIAEFTREFDDSTKLVIKSDQEVAYVRVAGDRYNNSKYDISFGKLKISGGEATGLFDDAINAITSTFEHQRTLATATIDTAVLVGGFAKNNWLWSQVQSYFKAKNIVVYRPDGHISKSVVDGAVLYHVNRRDRMITRQFRYDAIERAMTCLNPENTDLSDITVLNTLQFLRVQAKSSGDRIKHLENENQALRAVLYAHEQKHHCEAMYAQRRINDAAESLMKMVDNMDEAVRANQLITDWLTEFMGRCISMLETSGDKASSASDLKGAIIAYSNAVSLSRPSHPNTLLTKWASVALVSRNALAAAAMLKHPSMDIKCTICDVLEGAGRVAEAVGFFHQLKAEFVESKDFYDKEAQWGVDFQHRCREKLERLGDAEMDSENYHAATEHFSTILSSSTIDRMEIFIKRSKARALLQLWDKALDDADEAIGLDPSSHLGYEMRHVVLHGAGHDSKAVVAFYEMLLRSEEPSGMDLHNYQCRCMEGLEELGEEAMKSGNHVDAAAYFSTILSFNPQSRVGILIKRGKVKIAMDSWDGALSDAEEAIKLDPSCVQGYEIKYVALHRARRYTEAVEACNSMLSKLTRSPGVNSRDTLRRCRETLEKFGDEVMALANYVSAVPYFSIILSLNPPDRINILIKRSEAQALMESWSEALGDADEVIKLDPLHYRGYEIKHFALHGAKRYPEAVEAFDVLLSTIGRSPDGDTRKHRFHYIDARDEIRRAVDNTIRLMPRVLIDTATGRLYDKQQQAEAFKALPLYHELVSSMTTRLDCARIQKEVREFYRYVMLSHKWEHNEPLLQEVEKISIYDLKPTLTGTKLQKFCRLVQNLGFRWAWSDTCCVDKRSNVVLQESLVAMFSWYRGSSLTIVYLRGVLAKPRIPGGLRESVWNTRAWTYQEYVAAEIILFYTEDWEPYLGLTQPNHKESPDIISEMQQATGVSAQEMAILRPGLDRVREKLFLASGRETTYIEDVAYSLFGVFNVAIPIIYGEGNRAVGRLLDHILTGSGDATVLAWTGVSGDYNSCLPVDLTVYDSLVSPHIPQPIEKAEMDDIVMGLHSSLGNIQNVLELYRQLSALPSPSLAASRLKLPGISSTIIKLVPQITEPYPGDGIRSYLGTTNLFGDIKIETKEDLMDMEDLCVVHPWIRPLLDQEHTRGGSRPRFDQATHALRLFARLKQPFGALLFTQLSRIEYRRVATDSLIMAQICEVPLEDMMDAICTIEIQ